ncbi:MAG TPA: conjugal transfer protein TraD [Alphaproteobacteria bacterium]|nr:conjugal transfer protein TraD [Alphaproteobacteria bacterium]
MTQTNLIEKRKKLEQRKNRLKQLEASLNVQERKNRTRRLIELGGLVSKAQLENWNANALLGGLLFLKEKESDAQQMDTWIHKGGVAFSSEKSIKP